MQNAGRYPPTLTMVEALIRSSNTYFVALEDQLGSVEGPVRMAQRMGLFSLDPVADEVVAENRGSLTLGAEATSPLALASAYSTMAAGGTQCDPTPVTEILDVSHKKVPGVSDPKCSRVLTPEVARAATDAARCPVGQQSTYGRCNGGTADAVSGTPEPSCRI